MLTDVRLRNRARIKVHARGDVAGDILESVEIESSHDQFGSGTISLNREQVRHVAARLTQLDVAFGSYATPDTRVVTTMLPLCGAETWPVTQVAGDVVQLLGVKIHVEGGGAVYLMPDQVLPVRHQLKTISRTWLDYGVWDGEDAPDH